MEKYAIVIVTYNRASLLKECLEAVEAQGQPYDWIVVVDNASTDGTGQLLEKKRQEPCYVIIREKENIGGSGGFAHGVKAAYDTGADWITIIDDDAMLTGSFLEEMKNAVEKDAGEYFCYAGVPLTDGIRPGHRRRVVGKLIKKERPIPVSEYWQERFLCDIASFCGLMVHRAVISEIGFPEERFFIWYDDTEYCLRISKKTKIVNINSAVIHHKVPASQPSQSFVGWKDYYGIRNRIYMARKHYGMLTALYIAAKKILRCLLECGKSAVRGNFREVSKELALYYRGIRDGFAGKLGIHSTYYPGRVK